MSAEFSVGIHWPNRRPTTPEVERFVASDLTAVKLMWHDARQEASRIRALKPGTLIVTRLPDIPAPPVTNLVGRYVEQAMLTITSVYPYCRVFQVDNEPQYAWTGRRTEDGPWQYAYYLRRIAPAIRVACARANMPDVRLVSPPLSWSPALWTQGPQNPSDYVLDDWRDAFRYSGVAPEQHATVYELFDYVGCNCYWQDPAIPTPGRTLQRQDRSYGLSWVTVHEDAVLSADDPSVGFPVMLLEAGNSLWHKTPQPSLEACRAAMTAQYTLYVRELRRWAPSGPYGMGRPVVAGVFFFLLGGTPEWEGFEVHSPTLEAMGKW